MLIKLDSSLTNQNADNFEVAYNNFELQKNTEYELALVSSQFFYSFFNISSTNGNNNLRYAYSTNGGASFTNIDVTFEDGIYSISQINTKLEQSLQGLNFFTTTDGVKNYPIVISPNFSTLKVQINLNQSMIAGTTFRVDFTTTNSLKSLLGFTSIVVSSTSSGANVADITAGVINLVIHCSIITGSYDNESSSDVIFAAQPNAGPGALIEFKPSERVYLPLNVKNNIQRIRMRLTDQLNNPVILNDPTGISYLLHLRKVK
eukprot:g13733.t1